MTISAQQIRLGEPKRSVTRTSRSAKGKESKVFITNMVEVKEDKIPSIRGQEKTDSVEPEDWKELSTTPEHTAKVRSIPAFGVVSQRHHLSPTPFGRHAPSPGGPPNAYYRYHPAGPPYYPRAHPLPYPRRPPPPGATSPPASNGRFGFQRLPFRKPYGAVFRGHPNAFPGYPPEPRQPVSAHHPPSILHRPTYYSDSRGGSQRGSIFPSFSHPLPDGPTEVNSTKRIRQTASVSGGDCGENLGPTRLGGILKRRKVCDERQSESEERTPSDSRDGTNDEKSQLTLPTTSTSSTAPSGSLTPKPYSNSEREGKKLILTVSASPTDSSRGKSCQEWSQVNESESSKGDLRPTDLDSPGPAFIAFMGDFNEQDELIMDGSCGSCFENHSSAGSFNLLPLLDGEADGERSSPPMMPFLANSPQLSWDITEDNKLDNSDSVSNKVNGKDSDWRLSGNSVERKLTLKPQLQMPLRGNETIVPSSQTTKKQAHPNDRDNYQCPLDQVEDHVVADQRVFWPDERAHHHQQALPGQVYMPCERQRDDLFSTRAPTVDSRDGPPKMTSPIAPRPQPYRSPSVFRMETPPRIRRFPVVYRAPPLSPQSPPFTFPAASVGMHGIVCSPGSPFVKSPQSLHLTPQSSSKVVGESKGKCVALGHPLPSKFQGDIEQCKDEQVLDFSTLVNFPSNATIRQNHLLPKGTKCCVMCGCIRATCSRSNRRKNSESKTKPRSPVRESFGPGSYDEFVTIPTQNKGLCTLCDISVWVVLESGCQIKWCKGCKNFRSWAGFGDKGLATKCTRCRDRQREKYALQKDSKRREAKQTAHHPGMPDTTMPVHFAKMVV